MRKQINKTKIEWTDLSANPLRVQHGKKKGWACVKVSDGCKFCYAESMNKRFGTGLDFSVKDTAKAEWVFFESVFDQLRKEKAGHKVFLCDMIDLFQDSISDAMIESVFDGMWAVNHLSYQILTKRPQRMKSFINSHSNLRRNMMTFYRHVWLGTSVENQKAADERIPELVSIPAAVHFLSVEPMLEKIDLQLNGRNYGRGDLNELVNWVIVGGESGTGAREMKEEWARDVVKQCDGFAPVFVKQMGSWWAKVNHAKHSKGGDIQEMPQDLRLREFPQ